MKLEDKDYKELYPYVSPREIKEIYGELSYSERHIQRLYKRWGFVPQNIMYERIFDESYAIADIEQDEGDWLGQVAYATVTKANEVKALVNTRIQAKEAHYS